MVEIGERAGSGMDKIFGGWEWAGYGEPGYDVAYGPDRTTLTLPLVSADSTGVSTAEGRPKAAESGRNGLSGAKADIVAALAAAEGPVSSAEIAMSIGLGKTRTNELIGELIDSGHVIAEGATRSRRYRLAE